MLRGEVWWAALPSPAGQRPVLLLSRERAIQARSSVTVAYLTTTVRDIPTEVPLDKEDGMPKLCVVNTDVINTIPKQWIKSRICRLSAAKMAAVAKAVRFALDI